MRSCVAALVVAGISALATATGSTLPSAAATPPSVSADSQGRVDPAARCGPDRTAVVLGRTALSLVAVCTDGRGHYEYRGVRLSDRAVLVLPARPMSNGCFGARSDDVDYTVSERKLLLTAGLRVLRDEPMTEFVDYRVPTVVAQQTANRQIS
ncbi:hypothetical protein H7J06_21985 [Mycobacterium hodleri]|uniref:hypothetical protein n=1 Tax=Mycolicibacterium hodleri TaxID=49897 RepID=UPI0021F25A9E|nr:hypothetical protein [Mycolicibacterium hodleri]MCV7135649.1 hypothetical protein [Mycolicibacterium hodleri]